MGGYTGDCDLKVLFSNDGKYIYSADMLSLKKWSIESGKVVSEISPFPYSLENNTEFNDIIVIKHGSDQREYNLRTQSLHGSSASRLTSESAKKTLAKLDKRGGTRVFEGNDAVVPVLSANTVYRMEKVTGEITEIAKNINKVTEIIGSTLLIVDGYKGSSGFELIVDYATGKSVPIHSEQFYKAFLSPDKKYVITTGYDRQSAFYEVSSGKKNFDAGWGLVKFKSDASGFFVLWTKDEGSGRIEQVREYSYPDFKEVKVSQESWMKSGFNRLSLDADKKVIYTHSQQAPGKVEKAIYGRDIQDGTIRDTVSLVHTLNTSEQTVATKEREQREKIGNDAIGKLFDLQTPTYYHNFSSDGETKISAYTDDGRVLLYDQHLRGQMCILWSFPEGKPLFAYRGEEITEEDAPFNAVVVPGEITKSFLSPSGKLVGFNSFYTVYIYEGNKQKLKLESSSIAALLDDKALVWSLDNKGDKKTLSVVSMETGNLLQEVKLTRSPGRFVDTHFASGKVYFLEPGYDVWDSSNPGVMKPLYVNDLKNGEYVRYGLSPDRKTIIDRVTNKPEIIEGMKAIDVEYDESIIQRRFLVNEYWQEGFVIYDLFANKVVTEKTLFSGWDKNEHTVYLSKLNKLLVIRKKPFYTWPNPKPEDPGASAYTIDAKTGEIKPYLLTNSRTEYAKKFGDPEKVVFKYAKPETDCERMARKFKVGDYIFADRKFGDYPGYLVVAYDCERKVYVMAMREVLFPNSNSKDIYASRLVPVTEAQLDAGNYTSSGRQYEICPQCSGYPAGSRTEYYSGWSEWEQKSLNIHVYTRKWETTKKNVLELCKYCKGQAWVK